MAEFRKGGEAAREAAKASGAKFSRTTFLTIEPEKQVALRYLTDVNDWIFVDQHGSIPTKNKPEGYEGNWPESMPAVCRHDEAFKGDYTDCYICDHMGDVMSKWNRPVNKTAVRVWALAVLREEVMGTQEMALAGDIPDDKVGKRLGFRDVTREVAEIGEDGKPTDKTRDEIALVVVNMAPSNYFNGLSASASYYGTVCDRDFIVKRTGKEKDTEYTHIPLDPTPNLTPTSERWERYTKAIEEQIENLASVVASRADDEYYARFFDPTKTETVKAKGGSTERPQVAEAPSSDVDPDRLAAMRARVSGRSTAASEID